MPALGKGQDKMIGQRDKGNDGFFKMGSGRSNLFIRQLDDFEKILII